LVREVREQIGDMIPRIVVLDTLNKSLPGSESKDVDMAAYIKAAEAIRDAFDCLVIIVHHCGWDESRPRGHSSLPGAVDVQLRVERNDNTLVVEVELMRDGPEGTQVHLLAEEIVVGRDERAGKNLTSLVLKAADSPVEIPKGKAGRPDRVTPIFDRAFTVALKGRVRGFFNKYFIDGAGDEAKSVRGRRDAFRRAARSPNICSFGLAKPGCRLDQRVKHGLQVEGRTTDNLEHVSGRGLLLKWRDPGPRRGRGDGAGSFRLPPWRSSIIAIENTRQHTDSALFPIISQLERAAGFAHDDTPHTKLNKLDALLAQSATSPPDAALLAAMMSLPNDGRYPLLELDPPERRQRTLFALVSQVVSFSRQNPVLMIFEDAHWADPTSLELFDHVVNTIPSLRGLLIVTFRSEFEPPWIGRPRVTALSLNRLAEREVGAMIDGGWFTEGFDTRDLKEAKALLDGLAS
jgi:hypothetical protein